MTDYAALVRFCYVFGMEEGVERYAESTVLEPRAHDVFLRRFLLATWPRRFPRLQQI
jgi:hypothetical protein